MTLASRPSGSSPSATLRLRIDKSALASNWRALDRLSGTAKTGAAIKADCYGLGVDACLPTLREAGAERFFVAHWSEVAGAAQHVAADSISVLHGPITPADAAYAQQSGAIPTINSPHQAQVWNAAGGGVCDLMVDTGINRLGVAISELSSSEIATLNVRTLMSHLACADEDVTMNRAQLERLRAAAQKISHKELSLANSAGIALGADFALHLTRPGLALYGGIAREELSQHIAQTAYPEAAIIQTREILAGDSIGYNAEFTATQTVRVGTVSLGYADGFLRSWGQGGAYLMAGESRLPLLGKISMDMVVVDLSAAPNLGEGDWVSLPYFLPDAAQQSTLSQYELLTILGQRWR
ncbi:MAG: alanine racemase [Erythrobacter sp.]